MFYCLMVIKLSTVTLYPCELCLGGLCSSFDLILAFPISGNVSFGEPLFLTANPTDKFPLTY